MGWSSKYQAKNTPKTRCSFRSFVSEMNDMPGNNIPLKTTTSTWSRKKYYWHTQKLTWLHKWHIENMGNVLPIFFTALGNVQFETNTDWISLKHFLQLSYVAKTIRHLQ